MSSSPSAFPSIPAVLHVGGGTNVSASASSSTASTSSASASRVVLLEPFMNNTGAMGFLVKRRTVVSFDHPVLHGHDHLLRVLRVGNVNSAAPVIAGRFRKGDHLGHHTVSRYPALDIVLLKTC